MYHNLKKNLQTTHIVTSFIWARKISAQMIETIRE